MQDIDVKKLEKCFLEVDAELRSSQVIINNLHDENCHLRDVISSLLVTIQSFGNK